MNLGCEKCKYKDMDPHKEPCVNCWVFDERPNFEQRPTTNYDRIISKSPEELAKWIESMEPAACPWRDDYGDDCPYTNCSDCMLSWLKSPVEEDRK